MELADVTDSKSVGLITRVGSSPTTGTTSPRTAYRSRRLFAKVTSHSFCRGSFPNRNHFRWVAVWLLKSTQESFLSTLPSSSQVVIYRLRRAFLFSCKAHRALILLRLASKPNPLRWAPVWFLFGDAASPVSKLAPRRSKARFAPAFAWQCFRIFGGDRPQAQEGRKLTPRRFSFDAVFFCRFLKELWERDGGTGFFPGAVLYFILYNIL